MGLLTILEKTPVTDDQNPTPETAPETKPEAPAAPAPVASGEPEVVATPAEPAATPPAPVTQIAPENTKPLLQGGFYWGTGRRKSSVARVRIKPGDGKFLINKREVADFFRLKKDRDAILAPLTAAESTKGVDVFVNVVGGGLTGQAGAIVLGLARALCKLDGGHEQAMRDGNYLTRDSRVVERKKYGQRGARRRFQFSKR